MIRVPHAPSVTTKDSGHVPLCNLLLPQSNLEIDVRVRDLQMNLEKQTIESTHTYDASSSQEKLEIRLLIITLYSSFAIALLILFLPHQNVNGSPVPTFLFAAHPSLFHALVFAVMLSFAAASGGLLIGINSRRHYATVQRCYFVISVVSLASALSILACASFLEIFKLVCSWINLRQLNEDEVDSVLVFRFRKIGSAYALVN